MADAKYTSAYPTESIRTHQAKRGVEPLKEAIIDAPDKYRKTKRRNFGAFSYHGVGPDSTGCEIRGTSGSR
jgi:hypothetical protein